MGLTNVNGDRAFGKIEVRPDLDSLVSFPPPIWPSQAQLRLNAQQWQALRLVSDVVRLDDPSIRYGNRKQTSVLDSSQPCRVYGTGLVGIE